MFIGDDIYFRLIDGMCIPCDKKEKTLIRETQYLILNTFEEDTLNTVKSIVEKTGQTQQNVKYHLDRLLKEGLIVREERGKYKITNDGLLQKSIM